MGKKKKNYKVGRNKPPKGTRFKKGKSGNPAGRPKGVRNFAKVFNKELDKKITVTEDGVRHRVDKSTAMAKRIIQKALEGDAKFLNSAVRLLERQSNSEEEVQDEIPPTTFELGLLRKYLPYLQELAERKDEGKSVPTL